jgi:hypothetical protein
MQSFLQTLTLEVNLQVFFMQHPQPKGSIVDTEVTGCTTGRPNVQTVEISISSLAP